MSAGAEKDAAAAPQGAAGGRYRTGREVSIDWLEASVKEIDGTVMYDLLVEHLGLMCRPGLAQVFRNDLRGFDAEGPLGLRVREDRVGQVDRHGNRRPWVGVRVPGEMCRAVGTAKVLDLVEALAKKGDVKVSRVDVALDDFDKSFTPRRFAETCVDGRLDDENARLGPRAITRVKRENWEWSRRKGGCFWLGGRGSARLLRVYDKDRESAGRIRSTRVELQSRNEFATEMVRRLLQARARPNGIADVFLGHLVEFVDLREPTGARSASQKWPRLPWWGTLVGEAKGITTPGPADSEVWQWVEGIRTQFRGTMTVLLRAAGVDPKTYAVAGLDDAAARKVVSAVRSLVGPVLAELSANHRLRLDQLLREGYRRVARWGDRWSIEDPRRRE